MLKRKAYDRLKQWKLNVNSSSSSRALLVTGARQVGKSYIIEKFAKEHFTNYVHYDLLSQPDFLQALQSCNNSDDVFMALSAFGGEQFIEGDTCVFIDEVQEFEEAVTFVKYLCQRSGYYFILSGSLLGVELRNIKSQPVGYLDIIEMYPLDFEEFCWAAGVGQNAIEHARESYVNCTPVLQPVYEKMLDTFHKYLMIGGMPADVQTFIDTQNIAAVKKIQSDIIKLYRADISKYSKNNSLVIKDIYDKIPAQLATQSKKFNFSLLAPKGTYERYSEDFIWMIDAGVALCVTNVAEPRHPLKLCEKRSYFKLFANDVGLLCAMCEMDIYKSILSDDLGVNFGSIYENAVAQELTAHNKKIRYFRNKKLGEIDFVIENGNGQVLPIEVKSGKYYKRHSALSNIMNSLNYSIDKAVVLCESNVQQKENIYYLPAFMVMFIE